MANVWDPNRNLWVDDQTGNTLQPTEYGGDNIWHNPSGQVYVNGQWLQDTRTANGGTAPLQLSPVGQSQALPVGQPQVTGQTGAFQPVPGSDYLINQQQNSAASQLSTQQAGQASSLANQNNAAAAQLQTQHDQSTMAIAQLTAQVQAETAKGNNASAERIAQLNYQIAQEQNRLQGLQVQINQEAEQRQERQLQANLAANPQDFVAYEYYKRALGNPTALGAVSNNGGVQAPTAPSTGVPNAGNGNTPDPVTGQIPTGIPTGGADNSYYAWAATNSGINGAASGGGVDPSAATPGVAPTSSQFSGTNYSPAPPAYNDPTLANVANSIQSGGQAQWNPALSGQGAFGSTIDAPNQIGRNTYGSLSPSEQAIMQSFLNAGVQMNGQQVSIDPSDYLAQMQKSWVPTLSGGVGQQTQYSE